MYVFARFTRAEGNLRAGNRQGALKQELCHHG